MLNYKITQVLLVKSTFICHFLNKGRGYEVWS